MINCVDIQSQVIEFGKIFYLFFYFLDLSRAVGPQTYCHNTSIENQSANHQNSTVISTELSNDRNQPGIII